MAVSFLQREVPGMTVTVPGGSVNDGAAFGNAYGQFIRVNFALTRQKLQEALERIRQALDEKA